MADRFGISQYLLREKNISRIKKKEGKGRKKKGGKKEEDSIEVFPLINWGRKGLKIEGIDLYTILDAKNSEGGGGDHHPLPGKEREREEKERTIFFPHIVDEKGDPRTRPDITWSNNTAFQK